MFTFRSDTHINLLLYLLRDDRIDERSCELPSMRGGDQNREGDFGKELLIGGVTSSKP
jgi:hypothetical protein